MVTGAYAFARETFTELVCTGWSQMFDHLDLYTAYSRQQEDIILDHQLGLFRFFGARTKSELEQGRIARIRRLILA